MPKDCQNGSLFAGKSIVIAEEKDQFRLNSLTFQFNNGFHRPQKIDNSD